jgi:dipeptidyl aminopeptidase/acylaminoacyl peptidase
MKLLLLVAAAVAAVGYFARPADAADKRPIQVDDLFKFKRVADPQVSPDGKLVVYQVTTVDLEGNKSSTALWLAATDGKTPPKQLTNPNGKKDTHPRWSPDGKQVLFESTRAGTPQLFVIDLAGGEARKLTDISTGAGTAVWSPDGSHIAFVSAIFPEFSTKPFAESDKLNKEKEEGREKSPVKARVSDRLFHRHWDSQVENKRQHLFVCDATGKGVRDVTPGDRDAYPTSTTFSVGDDFTFSPDGKFLVFTAVPEKGEAWSTNHDLCRVAIDNTSTDWPSLTSDNKGADNSPRFSPDGKKLAWRSQKRAGYEADKWDIKVVDVNPDGTFAGEPKTITAAVDVSADGAPVWLTDGDNSPYLAFAVDSNGRHVLAKAFLPSESRKGGVETEERDEVFGGSVVEVASGAGRGAAFLVANMGRPAEVVFVDTVDAGGRGISPRLNLSKANDALLATLDLPKPESVRVTVEGGDMQMWVLKPPGFDPKKKWPVAYLVHGGPQGAWEDGWSYRWNPQVWAAQGYVVALPNPRGSTGFGQKFVDEISGDWGGKCYRDLVAGVEYLKKQPYVDADRMGSAGASFGGYMMNWFAVSPIAKEFKCLITHCSVWNFESMWGTTDELWFDEWEHQGLPWEKPGSYAEFSPHKKAGELGKYRVPMLVIHNDLDFRCPIGQGHELFSALQRQGVRSRFVNFPDEGHWVTKPQNSKFWHQEVFAWLTGHVPPGGR